jgi:hypothetical protein
VVMEVGSEDSAFFDTDFRYVNLYSTMMLL